MKKNVNPAIIKENSQKKENKARVEELEAMNWTIEEKSFEIHKLQLQYAYKNLKYLEALGYELEEKEKNQLVEIEKELESYGCALC